MTVATVRAEEPLLRAADLDTALNFLSLTVADFEADRLWAEDDSFLLPVIKTALQSPLAAREVLQRFAAAVPDSLFDNRGLCPMGGQVMDTMTWTDGPCRKINMRALLGDRTENDSAAADDAIKRNPFHFVLQDIEAVRYSLERAFIKLNLQEQDALLLGAPLWFADADIAEDDTLKGALHRAFNAAVDTTRMVDADSVLTLFSRVYRPALVVAGDELLAGIRQTVLRLKHQTVELPAKRHCDGVEGDIVEVRDTEFGRMIVGGPGPNIYTGDFAVIIDLGGDDQYLGRTGGAIGNIGHSVSAIIDMGGNDLYRAPGMVSQGCGVMGIGALVDLSGDDIYEGGAFCQGAAFCGAGLFFDEGGNDTYRASMFAQGAAICGVSVLVRRQWPRCL